MAFGPNSANGHYEPIPGSVRMLGANEVVLIDLRLAGMDGYEVARALRASPGGGTASLIAVTGYGQAEDRREALAAGFDLHVTKPVDPAMLDGMLGLDSVSATP